MSVTLKTAYIVGTINNSFQFGSVFQIVNSDLNCLYYCTRFGFQRHFVADSSSSFCLPNLSFFFDKVIFVFNRGVFWKKFDFFRAPQPPFGKFFSTFSSLFILLSMLRLACNISRDVFLLFVGHILPGLQARGEMRICVNLLVRLPRENFNKWVKRHKC